MFVMLGLSQMCSGMLSIAKRLRQTLYRKPINFLVNSLSRCDVGFVFNQFQCVVNRKSCIEDIIIENVQRLIQFRELRRACDCTGAKVRVSQRLKSLRGILVRNCGFSESDFFVVCEDIWIAICPFLLQWFNPKPKPCDGNRFFIIYAQWVPSTKFVHAIS